MDTGNKSSAASPTKEGGSKRPAASSFMTVNGLGHSSKRKACPEQIGKERGNSHLNPDKKIKAGSFVTAHHTTHPKKKVIKKYWSEAESELLIKTVNQFERKQLKDKEIWMEIAKAIPGRNTKQCKERWKNHLNPDIRKDAFSLDEENVLIEAHQKLDFKWAKMKWTEISRRMLGRAENTIKNRWNTAYRKIFKHLKPPASPLEEYIRKLGPRPKVRPSARNGAQKLPPAETYGDASSSASAGSFCTLQMSTINDRLQNDGNDCSSIVQETYANEDIQSLQPAPAIESSTPPTREDVKHMEFLEELKSMLEERPPPSLLSRSTVETCRAIPNQAPAAPITCSATSSQREFIPRSHIDDDWLHSNGNVYSALPGQVEDHSLPMATTTPALEMHYPSFYPEMSTPWMY